MRRLWPMARVSLDLGDLTDSIERQCEKFALYQQANPNDHLLPPLIDRSISGAIAPADRPALGSILRPDKLGLWDGLIITTQDRLSRSDLHTFAFIAKLLELQKQLVILDDPSLDMTTLEGRLQLQVKAYAAAKELERIRSRFQDSHDARRYTRAWHGGIPPYGYVTKYDMVDGKRRKVLTPEDYASNVIRSMSETFIQTRSWTAVAESLNNQGELSPYDYHRALNAIEPHGVRWSYQVVRGILTSPATMGIKMMKNKRGQKVPLLNPDGETLTIAEPLLTQETWDKIQDMKVRIAKSPYPSGVKNNLRGVAICGECEYSAAISSSTYTNPKGRKFEYSVFRCNNPVGRCSRVRYAADDLLEYVDDMFRHYFANTEITEKEWSPGTDASRDLEQVELSIKRLQSEKDNTPDWDDLDESEYQSRMTKLRERRRILRALPHVPGRWEDTPTGRTWGELWETGDDASRNRALRDCGVKVRIYRDGRVEVTGLPDVSTAG